MGVAGSLVYLLSEGVEDPLLGWLVGGVLLGVPLYAQDPVLTPPQLEALDEAVVAPSDRNQV